LYISPSSVYVFDYLKTQKCGLAGLSHDQLSTPEISLILLTISKKIVTHIVEFNIIFVKNISAGTARKLFILLWFSIGRDIDNTQFSNIQQTHLP